MKCEPVELAGHEISFVSNDQSADVEGAVGNVGGRADFTACGQIIVDEGPSMEEFVASEHEFVS